MSAELIAKFNETNSRLDKERTLAEIYASAVLGVHSAVNFLILAKLAYDPFVTFGIKKIEPTVDLYGKENPWDEFLKLLDKLAKRELTGNAARRAVTELSTRFDSNQWNDVCVQVIKRDLRIGVTATTINKILAKTPYEIPIFSCQLATTCEGNPEMRGKKRLERKLDGVRMLAVVTFNEVDTPSVTCYSRNGKELSNFTVIERELLSVASHIRQLAFGSRCNGFVLDGEVMSTDFQALMKQVYRKSNVNTDDSVYHVFDIMPIDDFRRGYWNMQANRRMKILQGLAGVFSTLHQVKTLSSIEVDLDTADGISIMHEYATNAVEDGFEGIMIKSLDAPYVCKRSTFWLKWKPVYSFDLNVVGIEEGTGKYEGSLGALVFEGVDDGKLIKVNVGSGYTDTLRQEIFDNPSMVIGQIGEVLTDGVTQNQDGSYSLRFPRFKCFRDDKQ